MEITPYHELKDHYMTSELLTERKAAAFCQLALSYFKNLRRTGRGPTFLRPSPRVTMYRTSDLEAWMGSWQTAGPTKQGYKRPAHTNSVGSE